MSGQFPKSLQSQDVRGSFLDQAACNNSYSSLPTSSVTSTYSSALSSTWPSLTQSNDGKNNKNGSCVSENTKLDPDALMKLLSDAGEPFFHHPPETVTTPTFSSKLTSTSMADQKSNAFKANDSTNSSQCLLTDRNDQCVKQVNPSPAGNSSNSGKTSLCTSMAKTDSTMSTHSMKTVSSSEVKESLANASNVNSSTPKTNTNAEGKPKGPSLHSTPHQAKVVVTLKDPSPKCSILKPEPPTNSGINDTVKPEINRITTPKSASTNNQDISPNPDNVESLLESMFQISDAKSPEPVKISPGSTQKSRVLRAESVEKILKSPSPPSFNGECNLDVLMKSPTKDAAMIKQEPVENLEAKENDNPQKLNGKTQADKPIKIFNEIESELEKMFAGIVEPETSVKTEPALKTEKSSKKIKSARRSSDNSILSSCSSSDIKRSKKSFKRFRDGRKDGKHLSKKFKIDKDTSNDSFYSKLRGPVIHVEGPKENPTSYTIINCRSKPEDEETQDSKVALLKKKGPQRISGSKATEGSLETIKSTDEMWICLFCKKGPHVPGVNGDPSGDLFGPYYIKDKDSVSSNSSDQKVKKKKKLTDAKAAMLLAEGVLTVPNSNEFEVWVHENCCVWASGVYLVGSKLQGLDDAVWAACGTKCDHCGISGASIGCAARHCRSTVHYSCALHRGWHLDQETFITQCSQHENSVFFSPSVSCS
ncbi:unnamed protein product [Bemisia tabaci]|uniref:PHD-type domain-containing protein n=1 Tax=Bemisia tabaci TaxID=7038 RepID=A0A9P0A551_BEMTA|nr:unnamed protein product [Bemisia tabaci]